jgi:hypothetical protein
MNENNIDEKNWTSGMIDRTDDITEKRRISYIVKGWRKKIEDINKKYSKPRLKMTPLVKVTLFALRLYLIILVIILIYKFYTLIK